MVHVGKYTITWVSNLLYFHPDPWGRWTHFDEHMFQMGWNNQPVVSLSQYLPVFFSSQFFSWISAIVSPEKWENWNHFPFESSDMFEASGVSIGNETWENSDLKQTFFSGFAHIFCETERVASEKGGERWCFGKLLSSGWL